MVDKTSKEPIQEFATADGQTLSLTAVLQPEMDVLCVAQELVHRDMGRRGYDVIRNCFLLKKQFMLIVMKRYPVKKSTSSPILKNTLATWAETF